MLKRKKKEVLDIIFQNRNLLEISSTKTGDEELVFLEKLGKQNLEENYLFGKKTEVNAQEWLDENYPREERATIAELFISEQLEGVLNLTEFTYQDHLGGVKVFIFQQVDPNKFQIINQGKNVKVIFNSWVDIHNDFAKEWDNGKNYQQLWEVRGLTYQDTNDWIKADFVPSDSYCESINEKN